jgi:hypothetical protein
MSESSNKKRKSETIPASPVAIEEVVTPEIPVGDLPKADDTLIGEALTSPAHSSPAHSSPTHSSPPLRNPVRLALIAGLGAGLFGGVLSGFIVLASPQLYNRFFAPSLTSRITAISTDKSAQDRIAALEAKLAAINAAGADVSKTDMTVSTLLSRVETLEKTPAEPLKPDAALTARMDRLEAALNAPAKPQAGQAGTALMAATEALRRKFERGMSFAPEFKAVETWADPSLNLGSLKRYAETGVPNMRVISQRFNDMNVQLAREALTTQASHSTGLLDRVGQAATGLVKVRPNTELNGRDSNSLNARIEASLVKNDAGIALDDLVKLPEPALSRAEPIIATLKARLDVEATLRALEQYGLQNLNLKNN